MGNRFVNAMLLASKSISSSMMPMSTPVLAFISLACERAKDIGVMRLLSVGVYRQLLSVCLMSLSIYLDWILAMSLTAVSANLNSRGKSSYFHGFEAGCIWKCKT